MAETWTTRPTPIARPAAANAAAGPIYPPIPPFAVDDDADGIPPSSSAIGAAALQYVMQHGHAIAVPDRALYHAVKVAVLAIAQPPRPKDPHETPRQVHAAVLREVGEAIRIIEATIRRRDALDREQQPADVPSCSPPERPNAGPMARLIPRQPTRPPAAAMARPGDGIDF